MAYNNGFVGPLGLSSSFDGTAGEKTQQQSKIPQQQQQTFVIQSVRLAENNGAQCSNGRRRQAFETISCLFEHSAVLHL